MRVRGLKGRVRLFALYKHFKTAAYYLHTS